MYRDDDLHPQDELRRQFLVRLLTLGAFSMTPLSQVHAFWGVKAG